MYPCHTLPTQDNKPYLAIAFDGCFYYLTMPHCKGIFKFDTSFSPKGEYQANRCFHGLCYDSIEECFWATEITQYNKIFKLNGKLQEIDCISFDNHRCDYKQILGISFDCGNNVLLLAFHDAIVEVTKTGQGKPIIQGICPQVLNVAAVAPYVVVATKTKEKQALHYYEAGNCGAVSWHLKKTEEIPSVYFIRDIVYHPCQSALMVLATKHCRYPRVICHPVDLCVHGCHMALCHKKCKPKAPDDKSSIIQSVAHMETALSHILNAEGEKLQKAVELAGSVEELLAINQSIQKTLMLSAQLEQILYAKLQAAIELEN